MPRKEGALQCLQESKDTSTTKMSELSFRDRDVMLRALVTRELADKVEAEAARDGRSLSAMIALLLVEAPEKRRKP
jgi:hypothetical protein